MTGKILAMIALLVCCSEAAGELRLWKSRGGSSIEAVFVKEEKGGVTLKRADGTTLQVKLDALCDEDVEYVRDITSVAREIEVVLRRERPGRAWSESGKSTDATMRDSVTLRLDTSSGNSPPELAGDTTWWVESLDILGKSIRASRDGGGGTLTTDGMFAFLTYRVRNDARRPLAVVSPRLHDSEGRVFTQVERANAHHYIPEGTLLAGPDMLQPGLTKLYCAFYELPEGAAPVAIEIFPAAMRNMMNGTVELTGKRVWLREPPAAGRDVAATASADASADDRFTLFMNCVRAGASGSKSGSYLRSKARSLSYAVDLRSAGQSELDIKVKAFFIGEGPDGREVILNIQESEVLLSPGRTSRLTLTSDEISETKYQSIYMRDVRLSGAKLKGAIIQARIGGGVAAGWSSMPQWRKYTEHPDLVEELGVAKLLDDN